MYNRRVYQRLCLLACLSILVLVTLRGQVFPETVGSEVSEEPLLAAYIRYGSLESWQEDNRTITALTGKVELYQAHQTIFAESLIGWSEKKPEIDEGKEPEIRNNKVIFDEIYAEGNVKIIRGKDQIQADKVYYDFKNGTGIMLNVQIRATYTDEAGNIPLGAVPFVIRAKEIYQVNHTTLIARNASVTTCPQGKPHYHFWVKKIKFIWDEKGKRFILTHIILHIAGVPVLYWPYLKKTIGTDPFIRSVKMEKSTRFGVTTQIKYGININKFVREPSGEIKKDKLGYYRKKRWGDFTIQNTHFRKRGLAWEPELEYQDDTYAGFVKGYYIRDKGRDTDVDYDRQFLPLKQHHRGEGNLFHRQQLSQKLRLETEITWISDRNLRQEFMESVFKEGKEAESYVYGRYAADNIGVTMLERYRVNEFQDQTEYLPSANLYIINREVKLTRSVPLYFSSFTEGSNIRIRYDEQLDQGALRSWRIDSLNEFITRLSVKPFNITPFWSARYTSYEKCIAGDKFLDRFIASTGIKISSQFYRKFGLADQSISGATFIHLVSFDFRYANNYQVTTAPTSILSFDTTTDQIKKFEEFYFELRNQFIKKGQEVIDSGVAVEYYPKSYRDTTSQNQNNYFYPMNWITLAPDEQKQYPRRRFSNIYIDTTWRPQNTLSLYFDNEYNTYERITEVFNAALGFNPYPGWSISLSERYVKNIANAVGISLLCVPIEKWQLEISDQYDFEQDRYTNRIYTIRRDLHELFLEFTIWVDKGKDEIVYNVTLTPKGLFKRPLQLRSY